MQVDRKELLASLVAVQPGLDAGETVEQGSSFVFCDGELITFNDEIAVSAAIDLGVDFAVPSKKLVSLLKKLKDDQLEVEVKNGELLFTGLKAQAGLPIEDEVILPIDSIDKMGKFKDLPEDFCEALMLCAPCAAKDMSRPQLACVHVKDWYVEATDAFRISRYDLGENVEMPEMLIMSYAAKTLAAYKPISYSVTESWAHFRTEDDVYLSLRAFDDTYPPLDKQFEVKGVEIELPEELGDVLSRTKLFSAEKAISVPLRVSLSKNKMTLHAASSDGWIKETVDIKYNAQAIEFQVNNDFFEQAHKLLSHAVIEDKRMMLSGEKLQHVICLFIGE